VVSAQHAMLLKVGDAYWLKDLNSTNGIHINGRLFTYGELKDGDTIRFASVMAIFAERCRKRSSTCAIRTFWSSSPTRRAAGGDTVKMEFDDSSKEKVGRIDHVSLQHQMTHDLAIQRGEGSLLCTQGDRSAFAGLLRQRNRHMRPNDTPARTKFLEEQDQKHATPLT